MIKNKPNIIGGIIFRTDNFSNDILTFHKKTIKNLKNLLGIQVF